jgi:penicillin-binding protein 2A
MKRILLFVTGSLKCLKGNMLMLFRSTRFWKKLSLTAAGILVLTISSFAGYVWSRDVSKLDIPLPEPTIIFDRYGQKTTQLSSSKLSHVPYSEFPEHLKEAVIAVEDKRFLRHHGVDVKAIGRALIKNGLTSRYAQGGSTITQQLAKNMFLDSEKNILRKWKEAAYALKLEAVYSKEEILEFYLNRIYFGEGIWGIKDAAKHYFSKEIKDLTLEEAAVLAALPKAPTRYSPLSNKELALERRNIVLMLMKEQNYISPEQYAKSAASPLLVKQGQLDSESRYAAYVDQVIEEAVTIYGFTENQLLTAGLRIYTELEPAVQQSVETVYMNDALFPASPKDQLLQSAAVVVDHKSGGIRGLIGNRGDRVFRGFNRASQMQRQPGSTFKPLAVYAPALEKGYVPYSALFDQELNIGGYKPENYDHQYRGVVTLQDALTKSLNVPAVWLLQQVGIPAGADFVKRTGITLSKTDRNYALALGGLTTGVSPLQMAQAYSAFANGGIMHQTHTITKITTVDGLMLAGHVKPAVTVTDPKTAYTMTLLLQKAVAEGTGRNAALNRPAAGKSGTTQLPETAEFQGLGTNTAKDAWFVGYTPELTASIWVGYDKTDREHHLTTTGGAVPAVLFREILSLALKGQPVVPFAAPSGYVMESPLQEKKTDNKDEDSDDEKFEKKEDKKNEEVHERGKGKGKGSKKD